MRAATTKKVDEIAHDAFAPAVPSRLRLVPNSRISDFALARDAAQGKMTALADLYERHNRRVFAVCLGMTHNPSEAEDLTQEVFLHLLRKIGSFRGESQFSTWLHRLTVNRVLMHFRSKEVRWEKTREELDDKTLSPLRIHQADGAHLVEKMTLQSALAHLPRGGRAVFVLFEIGGYTHGEIAKLLGCSSGTSKSQLHRARMKLRRLLRPIEKFSGYPRPVRFTDAR